MELLMLIRSPKMCRGLVLIKINHCYSLVLYMAGFCKNQLFIRGFS